MQNLGRKLFGFLIGLAGIIIGSLATFLLMPVMITLLGLSPQGTTNSTPIPTILTAYALSLGMGLGIIPGMLLAGYRFLPITFLRYISVIPATFGVLYSGFILVFNLTAPWLWFGLVISGFVIIYPLMRPDKNKKLKQQLPRSRAGEACRNCNHTGKVKCGNCHKGTIYVMDRGWENVYDETGRLQGTRDTQFQRAEDCGYCGGRGKILCPECGGTGYV